MAATVDTREGAGAGAGSQSRIAAGLASIASYPALLFCALSLLFGALLSVTDPPLRGHDEPAHFLRAYAIARGEIVPAANEQGWAGVYLPAHLHEQFQTFFSQVARRPAFDFRAAFARYRLQRKSDDGEPPVFFPLGGSEAYSPFAYIPYIAAAWGARLADLDFVQTLYAMRLCGLAFMTAVAGLAIAAAPRLKWALFLIAMLPAALYGRAIVSADGSALSFAMLAAALSLRAACSKQDDPPLARAVAMLFCMLAKPPQIAFAFLEGMTGSLGGLRRRWPISLAVVAPGIALTLLWFWIGGAQMGEWRIVLGTKLPAEHFSIGWKLRFMLAEPLHFPSLVLATLAKEWLTLWRQLIGVLGWLDVPLAAWVYPALSAALALVAFEHLELDARSRLRAALSCLAAVLAYALIVFAIFFIKWTPVDAVEVWGMQGRYFLVMLPALAIAVSALANRAAPPRLVRLAAILGALVSGIASFEAIWRVNW